LNQRPDLLDLGQTELEYLKEANEELDKILATFGIDKV
jgi:hypothetical protein